MTLVRLFPLKRLSSQEAILGWGMVALELSLRLIRIGT